MRIRLCALVLCLAGLLWPAALAAQPVTSNPVRFGWDPSSATNDDGTPALLFYKLQVDSTTYSTLTRTESDPLTLGLGDHTARVEAETIMGIQSGWSPPLQFTVAPRPPVVDPACAVPFGSKAVAIFVTSLQRTGSGGAGSQARLDFQLASPNSPIVQVAVRSKGVDLRALGGTDLGALAGMWFTTPNVPGTYPLTVYAENEFGCSREILTTKSVTVP